MQAMTSLSGSPSLVTFLSTPFNFHMKFKRFPHGQAPTQRHDSNPSIPTQNCVAADVLATHRAPDSEFSHGCANVVIMEEP
jgi:hypothetical protein